jgi:hypothetical protein
MGETAAALPLDALREERRIWITSRATRVDGRRARDYEVCSAAGVVALTAVAFLWGRDIVVRDSAGRPALRLRRRRLFPLTGRVDILSPSGRPVGAVYRSGRCIDEHGRERARFRDARSLRERAGEGLLQAAFDAMMGGEGETLGPGPSGYVCVVGDRAIGALAVGRVPFPEAPGPPSRIRTLASKLFPQRVLRNLAAAGARRGWCLQLDELPVADPLLIIGAALFMVEISKW